MVCEAEMNLQAFPNRLLAEKLVKVPEMAESISEGTLKQWSKGWSTKAR